MKNALFALRTVVVLMFGFGIFLILKDCQRFEEETKNSHKSNDSLIARYDSTIRSVKKIVDYASIMDSMLFYIDLQHKWGNMADSCAILYFTTGREKYRLSQNRFVDSSHKYSVQAQRISKKPYK